MHESSTAPLVIITGASSGIGAATARRFAAAKHPLLLLARRVELCEDLGLPDAICAEVDVTDTDAVIEAIDRAVATHGAPDLLVNNAGIMPLGTIEDQEPQQWQQLFDVNCVGLLRTTQAALLHMVPTGRGTIVNVGSIAGQNVYPDHMAYCGTKFAVHAMSEQMRREFASHNIRVCVIAPGMVETELLSSTTDETIKENYVAYKQQVGGAIEPAAVAEAIYTMYAADQSVCIRELVIAPTRQDT